MNLQNTTILSTEQETPAIAKPHVTGCPVVLNGYAGVGGNRKKWKGVKVVAVEKDERIASVYKKLYPEDEVIVGDAHEYLLNNYQRFDFIWLSRPCQSHSRMQIATRHKGKKFPDMVLYEEIIFLTHFFKGRWVVENVKPYYKPLIEPTAILGRHYFWSNFQIPKIEIEQPKNFIRKANLSERKELMDWLDIHFEEKIYYEKSHCHTQILRNCVHPKIGLHVMEAALS